MLVEHDYPLIARGAGARNRQRARKFAQIEGVLNCVELEVLMRQRAVSQPIDKRMAQDRCVDGPDRFPEFSGEFHVSCSLIAILSGSRSGSVNAHRAVVLARSARLRTSPTLRPEALRGAPLLAAPSAREGLS